MSYIFVDVDEARRCAGLMSGHAEEFGALLGGAPEAMREKLEAFRQRLAGLAADLSAETEKYAAADEKMKRLHLMTNDRSGRHGE
ncbi:hypothetical protein SAMN02745823_01916 [Sporobacter termitidis DSM 10068]|uniref:Uncharacterized protein n=1 Tax=Sporobacter termitidis DSM 10068 TaxID=1123282 RepID=A0A1M5XPB1_9FIRM|nr:hypothetical protein [Sporobacter termitidis]SHI01596.1 hypothetical protein SAMN02745823_01916 [Sporobacter termitidis DSM 10068]